MRISTYENWARVICHLNGGFLRVEITDSSGDRINMPNFEIPTKNIPQHLLAIGSRFLLRWSAIWPEHDDTVEEYRIAIADSFEVVAEGNR
jgi:hypothetical protein